MKLLTCNIFECGVASCETNLCEMFCGIDVKFIFQSGETGLFQFVEVLYISQNYWNYFH